jgi:hypothetical protein
MHPAVRAVTLSPRRFRPETLPLIAWLDPAATTGWTLNGSAVAAAPSAYVGSNYGGTPIQVQDNGSNRPTLSGGVMTTAAGSTQYLYATGGKTAGVIGSVSTTATGVMPDGASGSTAGKGFTCTGITKDLEDGTWWVGNYGKAQPADGTQTPSIVHLSSDKATYLGEITYASLGITATDCQGVVEDPTDHTLWIACSGELRLYNITKAGAVIRYVSTSFVPNGVAYDAIRNKLISAIQGNNVVVSWIDKATGAVSMTRTLTGATGVDHLWHDAGQDNLYYTQDVSSGAERLGILNVAADIITDPAINIAAALSVEGIWGDGLGGLTIARDPYYHEAGANLNRWNTYDLLTAVRPIFPPWGSRFAFAGIIRKVATPGSAACVMAFGTPLAASPVGAGIFWASTTGAFRLIIDGSGNTFDFTNVAAATTFMFVLDIDVVAETATLYLNGALDEQKSIAAINRASYGRLPFLIGVNNTSTGGVERPSSTEFRQVVAVAGALDTATRQKIEGAMAWKAGQTALLPADHPYKNRSPL